MLKLSDIAAVRSRIARAHALAAARFRETFVAGDTRAEAHMEIQAAALLESAESVRVLGTIRYDVVDRLATPYVERGRPLFPFFDVERTEIGVVRACLVVPGVSP